RPRPTSISTSSAKASTKEAAKTYHWKRFEAGANEKPFSATSATQSTIEIGLMSDDPYSCADRAGYAEQRVKDTAIATQKACSQRFRRDELPDCAPYQLG